MKHLVMQVWNNWRTKRLHHTLDVKTLGIVGQGDELRQALRCMKVALLCLQTERASRPDMRQVRWYAYQ